MTESKTTREIAQRELKRIFVVYPSFRDMLGKNYGNETLDAWIAILCRLDAKDVIDIVTEIVEGRREPVTQYQKQDQIIANIASEATARRDMRRSRELQQIKYHDAMRTTKAKDPRFRLATYLAVELGTAVRDKRLTKDTNDELMESVRQWYRTGTPDQWLFESLIGTGLFGDKMIQPIYSEATAVTQ